MVRFYNKEELELLNQDGLRIYLENLRVQTTLAESRLTYLKARRELFQIHSPRDVTHLTEAALQKRKEKQEEEEKAKELTINEARSQEGLPEVPWGDVELINLPPPVLWGPPVPRERNCFTPDFNAPKMGDTNETTE